MQQAANYKGFLLIKNKIKPTLIPLFACPKVDMCSKNRMLGAYPMSAGLIFSSGICMLSEVQVARTVVFTQKKTNIFTQITRCVCQC